MRARTLLEESLSQARTMGFTWGMANTLTLLGHLARSQQDYPLARARYRESLGLYRTLGNPTYTAWCLEGMAALDCAEHHYERATQLCAAAAALRLKEQTPLPPAEQEPFDQTAMTARAALAEVTFSEAWATGSALTQEEAITRSLRYNAIESPHRGRFNSILRETEKPMPLHDEGSELLIRMQPRLVERLEEKKARLDLQRPLHPSIVRRLHEDLRIRLTYHSNAIEGNTLTLRETQIVIEEGVTIGGHSLREHLEATNHAEAFDSLLHLVEHTAPITVGTVLALHSLILKHIDPDAGQFRTTQVYIRGSDLMPPPASQVPALMTEWESWLEEAGLDYHPVVRATLAHHGFVAVHPFLDGNGRTGRLLLNLLLMREGYPPAFLLHSWAERYRSALSAADHSRYTPLVNLIGQAVEAGLDFYLEACAAVPDAYYQPLSDLARSHGRDPNYLGLLVRQGKLEATKRGSRWYSTSAALARYEQQVREGHFKPGRPGRASSLKETRDS